MLKNWKTTLAGVSAVLGGLADLTRQGSTGHLDPQLAYADVLAIVTGVGLVLAKDHSS